MSVEVDWTRTEEALSFLQNELKCNICNNLAKDPLKFGMCGDFFCQKCVDAGSSICPLCGIPSRASEVTPDKTVKDLLLGWKKIAAIINPIKFEVEAFDEGTTKAITSKEFKVPATTSGKRRLSVPKASKTNSTSDQRPPQNKENTVNTVDDNLQTKPKRSRAKKGTDGSKGSNVKNDAKQDSEDMNNDMEKAEQPPKAQPAKKEKIKKTPTVAKKSVSKKETPKNPRNNTPDETVDLDDSIQGTPKPPPTPNTKTPKCQTPMKTLMKKNYKGETPLHVACIKGNTAKLKSLLAAGANPNTKDNAGWTPLHEAVAKGFTDIVELLLDAGALVDVPGVDNMTPLHEAVTSCKTAIVKILVSRGANILSRSSDGKTPKDLASTDEIKQALETTALSQNNANFSDPVMNLTDKETVLYSVGLDKPAKKDLSSLAAKLSLRVLTTFSQDVTHLIVAPDKNKICSPSVEVLSAILCGCWIVMRDWLTICKETNETVDPSLFEIHGITDYVTEGPKRGRLNAWKQLPGLFNGCHFFLLGNAEVKIGDCLISRKDLTTLIRYGGGVILSREPRPEDIPEKERTVPYHTTQTSDLAHTSHFIIYGRAKEPALKYNMVHIKTLPAEWLVGCIANFQLLDPVH